jgi:hypothetical protein
MLNMQMTTDQYLAKTFMLSHRASAANNRT